MGGVKPMLEKTAQDFIADAEILLTRCVTDDDFVKIKTSAGNAILISEAEWDIMTDAMRLVLQAATT